MSCIFNIHYFDKINLMKTLNYRKNSQNLSMRSNCNESTSKHPNQVINSGKVIRNLFISPFINSINWVSERTYKIDSVQRLSSASSWRGVPAAAKTRCQGDKPRFEWQKEPLGEQWTEITQWHWNWLTHSNVGSSRLVLRWIIVGGFTCI